MAGIATCAMALIIVLSAFNGIESLVGSLYSAFDSDLRITLKEGKTFNLDDFPEDQIRKVKGVAYYSNIIEESVGLQFDDRQAIATIKGVDPDFVWMTGIDTMMVEGRLALQDGDENLMVLGRGIKNELGVQVDGFTQPMVKVFAPLRGKSIGKYRDKAFNNEPIYTSGVFSINVELDMKYVVVPVEFARNILGYENEVTAIEIGIDKGVKDYLVKAKIQEILGDKYEVKTRYEQNSLIYETTKNEKWITFMILSLILVISTFTVVASLTMLVLDKKQDVRTLMSMGGTRSLIRNIFFVEGMLINVAGGLAGVILGFLVGLAQNVFGLVRLENSIVEYYPIKMIFSDFGAVMLIVLVIGAIASWIPVRFLTRRHFALTSTQS